MPPELELVREWLDRARTGLRSAQVALSAQPPIVEDACFHCQQVVEKALKAFLVFHGMEFDWPHEVEYLLNLCVSKDDSFAKWRDSAGPLTNYATRFRYPYPGPKPTEEQATQAMGVARQVWDFALARLPGKVRPPERYG